MSQPMTQTRSMTSTMTAARVRNVMVEVTADFAALAAAQFATHTQVARWREDLIYIMENEASRGFQVQLTSPGHSMRAIDYKIAADGSIRSSQSAGGLDLYGLPPNTTANLFVSLDDTMPKTAAVRETLRGQGWGMNGAAITGAATADRSYSSEGYGVRRSLIGEFS